jgi:ATP-binding cassette, subfamily B (MDR/TAP), member 1
MQVNELSNRSLTRLAPEAVRNADKIAFIGKGSVLEYGSHADLVTREHGRYKRLFESSKRHATLDSVKSMKVHDVEGTEEEEEKEIDWDSKIQEDEKKAFDRRRARAMDSPDVLYMMIGSVGAVLAGGVFPMWGLLLAETIELLFRRVEVCPAADGTIPDGFGTCKNYWQNTADDLRIHSFVVAGYWVVVVVGCLAGNIIKYWAFGIASERLNKRVRDSAFAALLRQEVAFFDKRSVGSITSQLQDDAARIQWRTSSFLYYRRFFCCYWRCTLFLCKSRCILGSVLRLDYRVCILTSSSRSIHFMWQFALLAIGCIPVMGFVTSMEMKKHLGVDLGDDNAAEGLNTPGGVIVETLLNIRTVSALTLEKQRFEQYEEALKKSGANHAFQSLLSGLTGGLSMFVQQWVNALQMWFDGYLLFHYPEDYEFKDFLISNFAILFSVFGLGAAFQDVSDRKEVEKSAGRIFYLLDRKSEIVATSPEGKKLD